MPSSFFLILFYLTLQYCVGFAIYQNESATGIHVLPILNPPPSSLPIPSLWVVPPKHPVSCIEPGLATRFIYDIIHISMPFSQIIPPSPSPTEFKRLFYTSVSLLLSRIQGYCYHLSKFHIYALVYCIGVVKMKQGRGAGHVPDSAHLFSPTPTWACHRLRAGPIMSPNPKEICPRRFLWMSKILKN